VTPWISVPALTETAFAHFRRRAIFDCNKWDPQVGDVDVVARSPLVMRSEAWNEVVQLAEALAAETIALEAELAERPDLHRTLGLPRQVRRALASHEAPSVSAARIIRFDFHFTDEGWRISEANTDVPGGLNEASGFAALMSPHYPECRPTGDPASAYAHAIMQASGRRAPAIALVHATAYSDDQQMMAYLAARLTALGAHTHLASPAHLQWRDGLAHLDAAWFRGPLDVIVRFFPSEWLSLLPVRHDWMRHFRGGLTPQSNPSTAILTQTKRVPLVWNELDTPLPTWRRLLPETRDPRTLRQRGDRDWILKPALGRVGEGVGVMEALTPREQRSIRRAAWLWSGHWIAQRRFTTVPIDGADGPVYPCLGVYTVDRRVAGAYGRLACRPLIDARALDAAVLRAA
jgi:glutathionylspermidine synthase